MIQILRLNAGANHVDSVSRPLATALIEGLAAKGPTNVTTVELSEGLPFVDAAWMSGDAATTATSEAYISQLEAADVLVISAPIYNFSVPPPSKPGSTRSPRPVERSPTPVRVRLKACSRTRRPTWSLPPEASNLDRRGTSPRLTFVTCSVSSALPMSSSSTPRHWRPTPSSP